MQDITIDCSISYARYYYGLGYQFLKILPWTGASFTQDITKKWSILHARYYHGLKHHVMQDITMDRSTVLCKRVPEIGASFMQDIIME